MRILQWVSKYFVGCLTTCLVCTTALPAWAAISYVGAQAAGVDGTTSAVTVNFALTGGSDAAPAVGDLVVVTWCGTTGAGGDKSYTIRNTSATNYTLIGSELFADDVTNTNMRVAYRVMPDPTETQVVLSESATGGTGSVSDGGSYNIFVLRGVHATPLEQAAIQGTGINTQAVDPGDVTPTTAGSYIYVSGCGSGGTMAVYTQADLTDFRSAFISDTNDSAVGAGYLAWTSGTYSPATFGGGLGGGGTSDNSWAATIAVFAPAAGGSSNCSAILLMGIGGCQ